MCVLLELVQEAVSDKDKSVMTDVIYNYPSNAVFITITALYLSVFIQLERGAKALIIRGNFIHLPKREIQI